MKKVIALSATLFLLFSTTAFAGPPEKGKKVNGTVKMKPKSTNREPVIGGGGSTPRPDPKPQPAAQHGKKKGWFKNPHNPHHPQSNNPGHAKHKRK